MKKSARSLKWILVAKREFLVMVLSIAAFIAVSAGAANASDDSLLDWTSVFNADGSATDLSGGIDAVYIQDNISAGIATDMSVVIGDEPLVYNGNVFPAHDIGNGYVYATLDATNNLVIYAGVERMSSVEDTYIELEFNQGVVGVTSGNPWPIEGERKVNDLMFHMDFNAGNLSRVQLSRWDGTGYSIVGSATPPAQEGCERIADIYAYCIGPVVQGLPKTNSDVWDLDFNPVQVTDPDSFVQASVNVGRLLGENVEYTSIRMKTPGDVSFGSFRTMGYWGARNAASSDGK